MERCRKLLNKLTYPGVLVTLPGVLISAALLVYVFLFGHEDSPVAYAAYVFSAYITVTLCVQIPGMVKKTKALLHSNHLIHRYLTDRPFRMHISLYMSLGINLLYAVLKSFLGLYYGSAWFISFGVYYALLALMRFMLLRHARRNAFGAELVQEHKKCRLCGIFLLLMNIALSGVVVLMVREDAGFKYPGYQIYVMAMYAFYATISAVVSMVKYRKYQSPVLSGAKAVSFAAALVSLLSLETAMLSQFGEGDLLFRRLMTGATGAGVCCIVLATAVYMIAAATVRLNNLNQEGDQDGK